MSAAAAGFKTLAAGIPSATELAPPARKTGEYRSNGRVMLPGAGLYCEKAGTANRVASSAVKTIDTVTFLFISSPLSIFFF